MLCPVQGVYDPPPVTECDADLLQIVHQTLLAAAKRAANFRPAVALRSKLGHGLLVDAGRRQQGLETLVVQRLPHLTLLGTLVMRCRVQGVYDPPPATKCDADLLQIVHQSLLAAAKRNANFGPQP